MRPSPSTPLPPVPSPLVTPIPGARSIPVPPPPPPRSSSLYLHHLSRLIAKITVDEIYSAKRWAGGGFGDVYVLTHPKIGMLALKRLHTSGDHEDIELQIRRATREAETWRKLSHLNVLPFLDIIERSGDIYLVSPFLQNGSLCAFTRKYPDADRARLMQDAAAGIAYLHRMGIIHGDIKGANILVSDDIRALLCDFGLAREQENNTSTAMRGTGTVRWKSPELLENEGGKSFKSDVWAFAMTIYEILSGRVPYHDRKSDYAVSTAVMIHKQRPPKEPATSPTGVSYAPLWDVAEDCWHEDPDQRLEMQEAHDRLIWGGFRSLLLSPPPDDDEDTPKDAPIAPSPLILPSPQSPDTTRPTLSPPNAVVCTEAHVDLDRADLRPSSEEASTITPDDEDHTAKPQRGLTQTPDNTTVTPFEPRQLPGDGRHEDPNQPYDTQLEEAHDELIPEGSRSLSPSPPPGDDDDTLKDASVVSPPPISPSPHSFDTPLPPLDAVVQDEGHVDLGRAELRPSPKEATSTTLGDEEHTVKPPSGLARSSDNIAAASVKSRRLLGDALLGTFNYSVYSVMFSPDGSTIAIGSGSEIEFWDVEAGSRRGEPLKGHTSVVWCLAFSPDGTILASGSYDKSIRLWDVEAGSRRGEPLEGHTGCIRALAFTLDGTTIASGSYDGTVRFWDVSSGTQTDQLLETPGDLIQALALSQDGNTIAVGYLFHDVEIFDLKTRSRRGGPSKDNNMWINCLAYSPDGITIAGGSNLNGLYLWDVETCSQRGKPLKGHTGSITCLVYSPDGTTIASGSRDNTIRLWDVETGRQRGEPLEGHTDEVTSLSFSPDGMTIVSGSLDETVRLWSAVREI